jgi:RimJ/RimL family protein N-acetyltransferase
MSRSASPDPPRTFRTARLSAEAVSRAHLPFFVSLWSDERVTRTLGGMRDADRVERDLAEAIEHWDAHGFGRWLVRLDDGTPIGTVKLVRCVLLDRPEVEFGYAFVPDAWRQGYATEAGAGALAFGRDVAGLSEVVAWALEDNLRSFAVLDRLGFHREGPLELPGGRHGLCRRTLTALDRPA